MMNEEDKLKACPFCGKRDAIWEGSGEGVGCVWCHANGPISLEGSTEEEDQIAWNRRAPSPESKALVEAWQEMCAMSTTECAPEGWCAFHESALKVFRKAFAAFRKEMGN